MKEAIRMTVEFVLNLVPFRGWCYGCGWDGPNRGATRAGRRTAARDALGHTCKEQSDEDDSLPRIRRCTWTR